MTQSGFLEGERIASSLALIITLLADILGAAGGIGIQMEILPRASTPRAPGGRFSSSEQVPISGTGVRDRQRWTVAGRP